MCRHAASHGNAMVQQSKHESSSSSCRTPAYNGCHAYTYIRMEVVLVCYRKLGLEHDDDDVYLFICYCVFVFQFVHKAPLSFVMLLL